jgi:hypothetical protein
VNGGNPRTPFCFKLKDRKEVLRCMKILKFLHGYVAGLKQCVNAETWKLNGLKIHDYHIIMKRLMHVILSGYIDDDVWKLLVKLSYFYRQLYAKKITKDMM